MIPLSQEKSEDLARQAYEAYGATTDYKNFMGDPMPTWRELPLRIREAWVAASLRVRDVVLTEFLLTFESMLELARQQGGLDTSSVEAAIRDFLRPQASTETPSPLAATEPPPPAAPTTESVPDTQP